MLGNVVEEPVSAVPPPLNNVDCVEKDVKPWRQHWTRRDGEGVVGGGGENGVSFSPAVELIFQEFCPGL